MTGQELLWNLLGKWSKRRFWSIYSTRFVRFLVKLNQKVKMTIHGRDYKTSFSYQFGRLDFWVCSTLQTMMLLIKVLLLFRAKVNELYKLEVDVSSHVSLNILSLSTLYIGAFLATVGVVSSSWLWKRKFLRSRNWLWNVFNSIILQEWRCRSGTPLIPLWMPKERLGAEIINMQN